MHNVMKTFALNGPLPWQYDCLIEPREVEKYGNKEMGNIWRHLSSGTLRSIDWQLDTGVSGQPIGPVFFGEASQEETSLTKYNAT